MPNTLEKFTRADRDMIIVLNEKVDNIKADINELKIGIFDRVAVVETKVENLENWKSWVIGIAVGIVLLLGIVATLVTYVYINDINQIKTDLKNHINETTTK